MIPPLLVVPTLTIGQKWPGANGGYRIVLAFAPPNVYFMTDSGRTYTENLQGWEDDYVGLLYQSVAQSLGPLETILDVEADFLLGACKAGLEYGGIAAVKAIPGAAKAAANQSMKAIEDGLLSQLGNQGIALSQDQAAAIVKEITSHPKEVLKVFQDFEDAFKDLTVD
jgi:hypothetical protein